MIGEVNGLQTLPEGFIWGTIGSLISFIIIILGSYVAFVLRTIKKSQDNAAESFRNYKRDVALIIQELIECKNSYSSRIDKLEIELNHIQREHEKNHG